VAEELTEHDALGAHLDAEPGIDPHDLANPRQAAAASALSFTLGALLPPTGLRVPVCVVAVLAALAALAFLGVVSARLGGANPRRAVVRVLIGGALGLAVTNGVGHLFGTAIGQGWTTTATATTAVRPHRAVRHTRRHGPVREPTSSRRPSARESPCSIPSWTRPSDADTAATGLVGSPGAGCRRCGQADRVRVGVRRTGSRPSGVFR
jgi:hypothetical protein